MAIEKHTTQGLVLSHYETGESDVVCKIYTRDFGVISARQSSLRKSAKLRAHLVPYRLTNVTVVKGKEIYRIVGAREQGGDNVCASFMPHIAQLVLRFLPFEVKNSKLYDRFLGYAHTTGLDVGVVRICMMVDVMIVGGYMSTAELGMTLDEYKSSSTDDIYIRVATDKTNIVQKVRMAIDSSML